MTVFVKLNDYFILCKHRRCITINYFQSIHKEEENKSELIPKPEDLPDFKPNSKDLNSEHLNGENDPEETNHIDITINKIEVII